MLVQYGSLTLAYWWVMRQLKAEMSRFAPASIEKELKDLRKQQQVIYVCLICQTVFSIAGYLLDRFWDPKPTTSIPECMKRTTIIAALAIFEKTLYRTIPIFYIMIRHVRSFGNQQVARILEN